MNVERIAERLAAAIADLDQATAWSSDDDVAGIVSNVAANLHDLKLTFDREALCQAVQS